MKFLLALLFILTCSRGAWAVDFSWSGRAFEDTYLPTQPTPKVFLQENLSAWLQGDLKWGDHYLIRALYQGDGLEGNNSVLTSGYDQTTWRSRWREVYGEFHSEGLIVREGKQIISWGKSDGVNPTDYFSAKDFGFLNPDDEVRRLAGTSLMASYTPEQGVSPWNFILVTQFVYPKGNALIPASALPAGVTLVESPTTPVTFDNTEYGIKSTYSGQGWDISLSGFRGFNHQPEFAESSRQILGPSTILLALTQVYRHVWAVGSDASKSFEKWVLRFEGAYIHTENDEATTSLSIPTHVDIVIGAERPIGSDFRIQPQIFLRYFPRYAPVDQAGGADPVSQLVNRQIAAANALLLQYQDRTRPSASFRVSYAPEDSDWSSDLFLIYSTAGGDFLVKPQVSYKPVDNLKFTLGSDNYGGDSSKPLGSLKPYNSVYFEAKYVF